MKILLDHNLPRGLRKFLSGHEVKTAREMGWDTLKNGVLIATAARAGFQAFLGIDKNLRFEQNLDLLPLPVVVLECISNALPTLIPVAPHVSSLLSAPLDNCLYIVSADGRVQRVSATRGP